MATARDSKLIQQLSELSASAVTASAAVCNVKGIYLLYCSKVLKEIKIIFNNDDFVLSLMVIESV